MEIGVQISSLKPLLKTEAEVSSAFARLSGLGFKTVQLQWIAPSVSTGHIARTLAENGLTSVGIQDFYSQIRGNLSYYTELNRATGGSWLCVSRIPDEYKSRQGLDAFLAELQQFPGKLCFHPVSADFQAVPGMDAVTYLLDAMPELEICLDLYHLGRSCPDMPGFIRRYAGRICMVHFKDARNGQLVPAGQGDIPWEGVVAACLEAEVPYAFVEQETWNRDPFLCLKEAADWVQGQIFSLEF